MSKPVKHRNKWRIRWHDENGRRKSEVYDTYKDAKYALAKHNTAVADIKRGFAIKSPSKMLFNELADFWMEHRASKKRNPKDDESILRNHLRPVFGETRIDRISTESVDRFATTRGYLKPQTVKNILTLLGSLLRAAHDWGWLLS